MFVKNKHNILEEASISSVEAGGARAESAEIQMKTSVQEPNMLTHCAPDVLVVNDFSVLVDHEIREVQIYHTIYTSAF